MLRVCVFSWVTYVLRRWKVRPQWHVKERGEAGAERVRFWGVGDIVIISMELSNVINDGAPWQYDLARGRCCSGIEDDLVVVGVYWRLSERRLEWETSVGLVCSPVGEASGGGFW